MDIKDNKNPLFSRLVNVLLPGASQLYVNKDWSGFAGMFLLGIGALAVVLITGNLIQQSRGYLMPQGVCMGALLLGFVATLFVTGYRIASTRNSEVKAAVFYNSKRQESHESVVVQHAKIQKMRNEGLISAQEYDEKNA